MLERDAILSALAESYTHGVKLAELGAQLGLQGKEQYRLRKMMSSLVDEGAVERVGRGRYALAAARPAQPQAVGRIRVHPAGYGFVSREDGLPDVFVPAKYRGASLDGDRVLLYTWEGYKGTEGRVDEVLSRGRAKLTATLRRAGRSVFAEPDDPRIATDFGHIGLEAGVGSARVGQSVVVEISQYPTEREPQLVGRVVRVLGEPEQPSTEIEKIIACEDIPVEFPAPAMARAEAVPQEVVSVDLADRIDLRDRPFVTIDPETARDFDDALCIERGPHGPRVWVAVADVSHYVRPADPLDNEAKLRGVSVYLPDRVIPMLPFELSAQICSLNPGVDRLAMVVRIDYDQNAHVRDTGFAAAVIRSHARLDYPGVAAALSGDFRGRREAYRDWAPALADLDALARGLRARRLARGALDLEIPEAKVVLDEDDPRLVRDVVRSKGSAGVKSAYQLVEEFMIAANEAVGAFFVDRGLPTVWRVHAPPAEERLEELAEILSSYGVSIDVEQAATPVGMKDVIERIGERPAARALAFLVLRSLKQAVYSVDNIGHFGLGSDRYLHFTSPIRRYPDVIVHRLLKQQLHREGQASGGAAALPLVTSEELAEMAAASSTHERRAVEAEREAVSMYRAYLMRDHVGEEYSGKISALTSFGAFVEIDEPFVEGLIKLESLGDDYFDFDPLRMTLAGRRSGITLGLGDPVTVEVIDASIVRRQVKLSLVGGPAVRERDGGERAGQRSRRGRAEQPAARGRGRGRAAGSRAPRGGAARKGDGRGDGGKRGSSRGPGGRGGNRAGVGDAAGRGGKGRGAGKGSSARGGNRRKRR